MPAASRPPLMSAVQARHDASGSAPRLARRDGRVASVFTRQLIVNGPLIASGGKGPPHTGETPKWLRIGSMGLAKLMLIAAASPK